MTCHDVLTYFWASFLMGPVLSALPLRNNMGYHNNGYHGQMIVTIFLFLVSSTLFIDMITIAVTIGKHAFTNLPIKMPYANSEHSSMLQIVIICSGDHLCYYW